MATNTTNYNLEKPAKEDFYDVEVQNSNMDKIDSALKTLDDKSIAHDKNTEIHVTKTDKIKWDNKIDKVTNAAAGNIPIFDENGSVKDSGKSSTSFADKTHETKPIASASGVHGIRYYNNQMQVHDGEEWNDVLSSVAIEVRVSVASGSTVIATDGTTTLTETSENGVVSFALPGYGSWSFSATLNGDTSNTVNLDVITSQIYTISLSYFEATLTVTALKGSTVTVTNGSTTLTAESNGTATFTLGEVGTYSVYAIYDGVRSETKTVTVTTTSTVYSTSLTFITLTVNVTSGSTIAVTNGNKTYTKLGSGSDVFYLPSTGTWTVSASLSGNTASDTISITTYGAYSLALAYHKVYGVSINLSSSNPETAVTYTDDAVGMTAGSTEWDETAIFKDIKPCLLLNGVVQKYLNPDNFEKDIDGNTVDIMTSAAGNVMIEIPKMGYKIVTSGTTMKVQITRDPNRGSEGFRYYAHTRTTEGDRDYLYVGAYLAGDLGNSICSTTNRIALTKKSLSSFRTLAKANGDGYDILSFYPLTLLQCLFIIRYKNLNSQSALGMGRVDADSPSSTGSTKAKGMYYGSTSGEDNVKFAGIEDFWGNYNSWIDGFYHDSSSNILTAFNNFTNKGSGYTSHGKSGTSTGNGYLKKVQGTTETGFLPKTAGGSGTTYYADNYAINADRAMVFGGYWATGDYGGAFNFTINYQYSATYDSLSARLMYL